MHFEANVKLVLMKVLAFREAVVYLRTSQACIIGGATALLLRARSGKAFLRGDPFLKLLTLIKQK